MIDSTHELETRIKSLELARQVLDGEIEKLSEELKHKTAIELKRQTDPFLLERQTKKMADFFWEYGFSIVKRKTQSPADTPYRLAQQLWKCHSCVSPLLKLLYKAREEFEYSFEEGISTTDRTNILNLCQRMEKLGWITCRRSGTSLWLTPKFSKEDRNFFNGGWAEAVTRYLVYKTLSAFSKRTNLSHKVFWNVLLKKLDSDQTNSHDMELDIVVEIKDRFYIFETKSGAVLCIDKWIDRARQFQSTNCRFITCCVKDVDSRSFSPYKLFILPTLEKQLLELLEKDFSTTAPAVSP